MIRFIPDYSIINSGSQKQETELLSTQLTKESAHIYCNYHPDYDNVFLCAVGNGALGVKIIDVCCFDFKQKLIEDFRESIYS